MVEEDALLRHLSRLVEPAALSESMCDPSNSVITAAEEAGIVFRLDIKRFATDEIYLGHQVMLVVAAVIPPAKAANVDIHHLVDLGVIALREGAPDAQRATVSRQEAGRQLWAYSNELEAVWRKLETELVRYADIWIDPPAVIARRPLHIAVVGLDYFNDFDVPDMIPLPHIFVSNEPLPGMF